MAWSLCVLAPELQVSDSYIWAACLWLFDCICWLSISVRLSIVDITQRLLKQIFSRLSPKLAARELAHSPTGLFVSLSVSLFVCLFVSVCVSLYACLYVCPSVRFSVCLFVCLCLDVHIGWLSQPPWRQAYNPASWQHLSLDQLPWFRHGGRSTSCDVWLEPGNSQHDCPADGSEQVSN